MRTQKPSEQDEKDDEKSGVPLLQGGVSMPAAYLPRIRWAHKGPMRIGKIAHGKNVLQAQEHGVWKRIVHEGEIDGYLRDSLLSAESDVPMSRDAGYHIVQKRTLGISRRAFGKFLAKQAVLQITRDRVPELKKVGKPVELRGYLEMDLVEAKGRDIGKYVHHPVRNFYWITMIDRLTGWLEVENATTKKVAVIAPKIETMLKRMARVLRTPVQYVRSDKGSEFKAETQEVMRRLKIKHRFVKSGGRIEQANKTWQKIWYRLMRLARGDLRQRRGVAKLDTQAIAIFNNTLSSIHGHTPLEALDADDATLSAAYKKRYDRRRVPKYRAAPVVKGDRVRYLVRSVVGKHKQALGYKSYRGKHWSPQVYTVVKVNTHNSKYYVAKQWRERDELLPVPGVDRATGEAVAARHRRKLASWSEEIGDLALGDDVPESSARGEG